MDLEKRYSHTVYPMREVEFVRGEGAVLWDKGGTAYIDCAAGIGVASIGHANPDLASAIARQASILVTCPGIFYNDVRGRLMEKLATISPDGLDRVFLCNSGTEAVEAALKFARLTTGKSVFISAMRGFHGRTMGALSATHKHRDAFEPLLPGNRFVPFNNLERLERAMDEDVAGVVLEIVQGEGGVRPVDKAYIKAVRKLCDERGIVMIVDEVQTGFARTGKMFACELMDVAPDILTLAKAIAGGLPMGAVLCSNTIASALNRHGSTFGGNPLACAAAISTIEYIERNDLTERASIQGAYFAKLLRSIRSGQIRDIRQIGLMIGIELKGKARPVLDSLLDRKILVLPSGTTVVRLLPPLVITRSQLETVAQGLSEVLQDG